MPRRREVPKRVILPDPLYHNEEVAKFINVLMLYVTWLLLVGSWEQTLINWDVAAPASGLSTGLFYGVGVVFAVSTGLVLIGDLFRAVTGRLTEAELVMVKESEEQEEFEALQRELAERDRREATIDFTGTSPQQPTNFNAPSAVAFWKVILRNERPA